MVAIDSSVLIAAMLPNEVFAPECNAILNRGGLTMYAHGLSEVFSTLTGRPKIRISATICVNILEEDYFPSLTFTSLTPPEWLKAMQDAESRGVRGGAIFDYLHLVAARKAKAEKFYTLNYSNFKAFHRAGDPEIVHP